MSKKMQWLECVRGGAILLVVLGHLTLINGGAILKSSICFICLYILPSLVFCMDIKK